MPSSGEAGATAVNACIPCSSLVCWGRSPTAETIEVRLTPTSQSIDLKLLSVELIRKESFQIPYLIPGGVVEVHNLY